MSKYQQWLIAYIKRHPDFLQPRSRHNEVLGFLQKPLEDLSISRPKERLAWGIELPFDPDYVTYVWFDALINYVSFAGYGASPESGLPDFKALWRCDAHVIGKDILVPAHGIYWPIMLHALGFSD